MPCPRPTAPNVAFSILSAPWGGSSPPSRAHSGLTGRKRPSQSPTWVPRDASAWRAALLSPLSGLRAAPGQAAHIRGGVGFPLSPASRALAAGTLPFQAPPAPPPPRPLRYHVTAPPQPMAGGSRSRAARPSRFKSESLRLSEREARRLGGGDAGARPRAGGRLWGALASLRSRTQYHLEPWGLERDSPRGPQREVLLRLFPVQEVTRHRHPPASSPQCRPEMGAQGEDRHRQDPGFHPGHPGNERGVEQPALRPASD